MYVHRILFWTCCLLHPLAGRFVNPDHFFAPILVAPLDQLVEDSEWDIDEPHVVLKVMGQGSIRPAVPTNFVHNSFGMFLSCSLIMWMYRLCFFTIFYPKWSHAYRKQIICWVHLGFGLSWNDRHDINLVSIAFLQPTGEDVVVALGGPIQSKFVPGVLGLRCTCTHA